jgi:hypothetical protein
MFKTINAIREMITLKNNMNLLDELSDKIYLYFYFINNHFKEKE